MLLVITVISAILGILISLVVLYKNPASKVNRWLTAFLVSVCLWVLATNLLGSFWVGASVYPLRLPFVFILSAGYSALMFAYHLSNRKLSNGLVWAEALILAVCVGLALSPLVIQEGYFNVETGTVVALERNMAYPVVLIAIAYFLVKAIVVIIWGRRRAIGNQRTQMAIVLWAMTSGTVVGVATNVVLPNLTGTIEPARFAFIALLIFATLLSYAILRHSFMDIRLAIVRTLGYLLAIFAVAIVYVLVVFGVVQLFFPGTFALDGQILYLAVAVIVAISFDPLRRLFSNVTKNVFYHHAYDTRQVLDGLARSLVSEGTVKGIATRTLKILQPALRSDFMVIAVSRKRTGAEFTFTSGTLPRNLDTEWIKDVRFTHNVIVQDDILRERSHILQEMKNNTVAIMARIETSRETLGYIVLGYKTDGVAYSTQDVDLVRLASDELAVAVQNALRFEEISQFNITLKQEIAEATAQLRQTNSKLKKLDEIKDEFISMASHQLRTPLTSVKGYISMVLEGDAGPVAPQQKQLLEEAFTSAQRMVYLIGDFLNVSRLQTGKFIIEWKPTNLAMVVKEEVDQLRETAARHRIKLVYAPPSSFPTLLLDENKMRQVIMNFIDNAIFYTRPGGDVTVTLLTTATQVRLEVKDSGIGVPEAERHKLFSKFFRAENARKVRPDGTGIGLFMAKKVVAAHGGSIVFESQEGKGSTFGFTLPLSLKK